MLIRLNPSGASRETLQRRATFHNRKGRSARRRMRPGHIYSASSIRMFINGVEFHGVAAINYSDTRSDRPSPVGRTTGTYDVTVRS